jgi:hypothetical protein
MMTETSSPDIIRIDIPETAPKPQTILEAIATRELEGSRIRRSIARQKAKSSTIVPETESNDQPSLNSESKEKKSVQLFTKEEVYLLRQVSAMLRDILISNRYEKSL